MFVGDNITRIRERQKKSRKQLASDINVALETLRRYENNKRRTPLAKRKLLAKCLNTTLEEIETGVAPPVKKTSPVVKVHELCKVAAAVEDPTELSNDLITAITKAGVECLGKRK